ncbi:hypothetical protein O181_096159 [Austropuccinia psidii MF-1]|uniref:Uncharacterized protein n=1 Tax=Austropuccinia psidii MF-1 TaxID=1389203 RepID=A0A9Q3PCE8_9BASI|nr:hypothetical protein [Austropuccinia psidii MF-1]
MLVSFILETLFHFITNILNPSHPNQSFTPSTSDPNQLVRSDCLSSNISNKISFNLPLTQSSSVSSNDSPSQSHWLGKALSFLQSTIQYQFSKLYQMLRQAQP